MPIIESKVLQHKQQKQSLKKTIKGFGNEKYDCQSFKTIKHTKSKSKMDKPEE